MPKHSKEEAELQRIAKNLLAMPHTDRDAAEKEAAKLKLGTKKPST